MRFAKLAHYALGHSTANLHEWLFIHGAPDWSRPRAIQAVVNERCNYRCRYCSFWRLPEYQDELTIDQWQQALASLQTFLGRYFVQFAGGEPLLKKRFIELPEYCQQHGIDWGLITNGSEICEKLAVPLAAAGPMKIDISVDSADYAVHDFVRGKSGSLVQIGKTIKALNAAKATSGYEFPVRIKTTVHRLNVGSLPDLLRWAEDAGATSVDYAVVKPWTEEVTTELWPQSDTALMALEHSVETLVEMKRQGAPVENSEAQLKSMPDYFRRKLVDTQVDRCRLGLRDFQMRPDGAVRSCGLFPALGNIQDQSAEKIWRNSASREVRTQMVNCKKLGTSGCANLCIASQKPLRQQVQRGLLLLKQMRGASEHD